MDEFKIVKLLYELQQQTIVLWCVDGEKLSYSSSEPIPNLVLEKIKANKHELIQFLTERNIVKPYQIPHIFSLNLLEYPLSPAQERLWFLAQLQEQDNFIYNEPLTLTFDEHCNLDLLRSTIRILIERHACFRTLFKKDVNGVPSQIILPLQDNRVISTFTLEVESIDDQNISIHLDSKLKNVFDLSTELSIKCYLYHLKSSNKYVLSIVQHHIITDGASIGLFLSEFYEIYSKLINGEQINLARIDTHYTDYALWFKEYYKKENLVNQLAYWKNKLTGFQTLQIQKDNPKAYEYRSMTYKYEIEATLFENLKLFSRKNKTTLFVSLLTAFFILLNKYSNQNDIIVGTPINGRSLEQVKNVLGFFINTVALRAIIKNQRVCDFLLDINQLYIEGLKYQDLPFEILVDALGINRAQDVSPLFQVFFAYQKFIIPGAETDNISWFDNNASDAAAKFDITFDFKETDTRLIGSIQYKANLFLNETIQRMSEHYLNILRQMIQFPESNITELNVLTEAEYSNIIYQWNSTRLPYLKDKTINQIFEEQVAKTPNNRAVIYAGSSLTYFELNEKANRLANFIRMRHLNYYKTELNPETFIVISMERSLELVIAILAVIKAGGAYVPMDINYPQKRKCFILEDTGKKLILTNESHYADLKEIVDDPEKILVLEEGLRTDNLGNKNLQQFALPVNTVYVIYTSGSTGNPKGVCVTHLSLNNFVSNVVNKINLTAKKILSVSSFAFDMFCFDFFSSLCSGGTLILTDSAMVREPNILVDYIEENKPDVIIATPSLWHLIIDKLTPSSKLTILSAGEALHENLAEKLFKVSTDVWDAYGPTETTVFSILKKLSPEEQFSLGKPMPNVTAYILNENIQPVPIGVIGELYIGGECLAKGYLNRPELTKERFIPNPFVSEEEKSKGINLKIYKTGDLANWLPSGDIKYVGRNDFQVKISGHRIELEELEFVLNQLPKIKQCFVQATEAEMSKKLVVYYTAENRINEGDFRDYLEKILPSYMIPHVFIYLQKFPLNENGKIDIKNLPKSNQDNFNESIILPRNSTEKELSKILANLLNLKSIGVHDNIFDIGCDSLTAVQVQTKINHHFSSKIKVVDIFYHPTIEKLAKLLNHEMAEEEQAYSHIDTIKVIEKDDIAIIGYACSFPMSNSVEEYWTNIKAGKECVRTLGREECAERGVSFDILNHEKYLPYAGVVSDIEMFDAEFWDLSERDAFFMDPKMRLFLQQAWKALESSGYIKKRKQISTGLFACFGKLDYLDKLLQLEKIKHSLNYFDCTMSSASDYFLNRAAYLLGINGPLLSVDTTCSSAAVAVIEACEKLLAGKCNLAIVGGVNLCSAADFGHLDYEGMDLLSKDGHSRIFDERGGGIVRSDGVGVIVLKPLSEAVKDRDHIRAVIKGYGVSYDGMRKVGQVYPRVDSLKECIIKAQQNSDPANIDYVECHGMGFKLGEIFEFDALRGAFNRGKLSKANKCMLGSIKANLGHTGYASGIAQLIKLACMLEHGIFPPQINYENPYTDFNLDDEMFRITKEQQTWQKNEEKPRTAGMTSFGIGGTSAHIIVEEAPHVIQSNNKKTISNFLISISAKSIESLKQMKHDLANYLAAHSEANMSDVAYTLHQAREEFNYRIAFVCHDAESCLRLLKSSDSNMQSLNNIKGVVAHGQQPNLIFNCSDIIANPSIISKILYETESVYREQVDYCAAVVENLLGVDIRNNSSIPNLKQSTYSACVSCAHTYAMSRFLNTCGLKASVILGEGVGEYLAACLAGIISVDTLFQLFLMQEGVFAKVQIEQVGQANIPCLSTRTGETISLKTLQEKIDFKEDPNNKIILEQEIKKLISANDFCLTFAMKKSDTLVSQIGMTEIMICNNSKVMDDYAHILNICAQLWLRGVRMNWESLYSDKMATLIELPTYAFTKTLINRHSIATKNNEPAYS